MEQALCPKRKGKKKVHQTAFKRLTPKEKYWDARSIHTKSLKGINSGTCNAMRLDYDFNQNGLVHVFLRCNIESLNLRCLPFAF